MFKRTVFLLSVLTALCGLARADSLNMRQVGAWPTGSTRAVAQQVIGGHSCAFMGYGSTIRVINVDVPSSPYTMSETSIAGLIYSIKMVDGYGLIVDGKRHLYAYDFNDPYLPVMTGICQLPDSIRDLTISGGYAYVASGAGGMQRLSLINPAHPAQVGNCQGLGTVNSLTVVGAYAYAATLDSGIQIIDASNPAAPHKAGRIATTDPVNDISSSNAFLYASAGPYHMWIIDVSNPVSPVFRGYWSNVLSKSVAINGYVYGLTGTYVGVVRCVNPAAAQLVGYYLVNGATDLAVAGDYIFLGCGPNGLKVINASDTSNMVLESTVTTNQLSIHTVGWGSYRVFSYDHYAFINRWYDTYKSTLILDVQDPINPQLVGTSAFDPRAITGYHSFESAPNVFRITDLSDPAHPIIVNHTMSGNGYGIVSINGNYAYIIMEYLWRIVDISDPTNPILASSMPQLNYSVYDFVAVGNHAFSTNRDPNAFYVYDITNPLSLSQVGSCPLVCPMGDGNLAARGNYAYVVDGTTNMIFKILNVSDPANPTLAGSYFQGSNDPNTSLSLSENIAFVGNTELGVFAMDIRNPSGPHPTGNYRTPGSMTSVAVTGNYVYALDEFDGLHILQYYGPGGVETNEIQNAKPIIKNLKISINGNTIKYTVPQPGAVRLKVYNLLGQEVRNLVDEDRKMGRYEATWDGRDGGGRRVSSGVYVVWLSAGSEAASAKMVVVR